jgi:putative lipoic acid-binding regulatory protein
MQQRPEINYPTRWTYVVVGQGEEELMAHIARSVGDADHVKNTSRTSTGGRYVSIEVTVLVTDEEQRLVLFRALGNHPAVRVVI